jgi:putative tryptophan/tyrosine transport system substrate-binding protein
MTSSLIADIIPSMNKFWLIIAALTLLIPAASAANIAIIKSQPLASYDYAVQRLENDLKNSRPGTVFQVYDLENRRENGRRVLDALKKQKTDLIVTFGTLATDVAAREIRDTPIVFTFVLNPVTSGIISSFGPSGRNLTGVALDVPLQEQFANFKLVVPSLRKVGVLYNPAETGGIVQEAARVAAGMGIYLTAVPINAPEEVPQKIKSLKGMDGLWMTADSTVFTPRNTAFILLYTLKEGIPFMGLSEQFVKAGALLGKMIDLSDVEEQTLAQINAVLAGADPGRLPILFPRKIGLVLNLKSAEEIGLEIPADAIGSAAETFK